MRMLALALAFVAMCLGGPAQAQNGPRIALVIGNNDYQHANRLSNSVADARTMRQSFADRGFQVVYRENAGRRAVNQAVDEFIGRLSLDAVGIFYFSGHGVQINGINYLVPTDLDASTEDDVRNDSLDLSRLLDRMSASGAGFSLAIIDACRDNPLKSSGRSLGGTRGLAAVSSNASGIMVVYAAGANQQALDNLGPNDHNPNGLFTREFVRAIGRPGLTVQEAVNQAKMSVITQAKSIGAVQTPAIYDQSTGTFYFSGTDTQQPPPPPPPQQQAFVPPPPPPPQRPPAQGVSAAQAFDKGVAAYDAKQYAESLRWMRQAAAAGNDHAMDYIGFQYQNGWGVTKDFGEAMRWYRQAAEVNNTAAIYNIGSMYNNGWGVQVDYGEAMRWYRRAAEQGFTNAIYNIGTLYDHGQGVAQDYSEAMRWYRQAAEKGSGEAMNNIGSLYAQGHGVAKSCATARTWFEKAAAAGNSTANEWLKPNNDCSWN